MIADRNGKVAVVTGAASGIGRELALACARDGMRVVVADVEARGLAETVALLGGAQSLAVPCDVASSESVFALAETTYARFGAAHIVFNNAGVAATGPIWTSTEEDWQWVLGVNLMGVVHGIRAFVPRMLAGGEAGHIVNTASVAGLISPPGASAYCASKHGVVSISECLAHELAVFAKPGPAKISVSVVCPAFVSTAINESARNRPEALAAANPLGAPYAERIRKATQAGKLTAADIATRTMEGLARGEFYVLTHPAIKPAIEQRMRAILEGTQPMNPMP